MCGNPSLTQLMLLRREFLLSLAILREKNILFRDNKHHDSNIQARAIRTTTIPAIATPDLVRWRIITTVFNQLIHVAHLTIFLTTPNVHIWGVVLTNRMSTMIIRFAAAARIVIITAAAQTHRMLGVTNRINDTARRVVVTTTFVDQK